MATKELDEIELHRLKSAIVPYLSDWRSIDIRVIGVRTEDNERWMFNSVRAVLDAASVDAPKRTDLPKAPDLLLAHERWDISRLDDLISSVGRGEIDIGGNTLEIKQFSGTHLSPFNIQPFTLIKEKWGFTRYGLESASFVIEIQTPSNGLQNRNREAMLDSELRAADPPWDGLDDLRENFVQLREWRGVGYGSSRLDIVAPLNVALIGSNLEGNILAVPVSKSPLTKTTDLTVSVIATRGTQTMGRYHEQFPEPAKGSDPNHSEMTFALEDIPSKVKVFLGYRGIEIDSVEIYALTPQSELRARILEVEGIGSLENLLAGSGDDLERGVAILFHALGFDTANYGKGFQDSADIIALRGNRGPVLVIECTAGVLNQRDKLSKLIMRTRELAAKTTGVEFRSVVVTSLKRTSLSASNLEAARADRIIVVTADDIPKLLQMIVEGTKLDKVMNFLEGLLGSPFG